MSQNNNRTNMTANGTSDTGNANGTGAHAAAAEHEGNTATHNANVNGAFSSTEGCIYAKPMFGDVTPYPELRLDGPGLVGVLTENEQGIPATRNNDELRDIVHRDVDRTNSSLEPTVGSNRSS